MHSHSSAWPLLPTKCIPTPPPLSLSQLPLTHRSFVGSNPPTHLTFFSPTFKSKQNLPQSTRISPYHSILIHLACPLLLTKRISTTPLSLPLSLSYPNPQNPQLLKGPSSHPHPFPTNLQSKQTLPQFTTISQHHSTLSLSLSLRLSQLQKKWQSALKGFYSVNPLVGPSHTCAAHAIPPQAHLCFFLAIRQQGATTTPEKKMVDVAHSTILLDLSFSQLCKAAATYES